MSQVILYAPIAVLILTWIQTRSLGTSFLAGLQARHPDAFEAIPKPGRGMVQYGPLTKAQMDYIGKRGYKALGDDELVRLGDRTRVMQRLYTGSFVLFMLAFLFRLVHGS